LTGAGHPLSKITGDGIAPGFAVGLNWEPMQGTSIGLGYRSFIRHQISAYQTYEVGFGAPLGGTRHSVRMNLTTPETVTLSGRQAITDKFTALGTVEFTHWGREGVVPVVGSPTGSSFILNYKDGWFFALGGEYKLDPKWTLRAGAAYELSPVQAADRTMRLPDNDRWWLTAGASYVYSDRLTLDASYAYVSVKESVITQSTTSFGGASYSGISHADLHIIGLSARYKWDQPAAPVVSKY
jgi:long-chain fatty acid transport protein